MDSKECTRCRECKPLTMFSPLRKHDGSPGHHSQCKACRSAHQNAANKAKTHRRNEPPREIIWPREPREAFMDSRFMAWRGPVESGALSWRIAA